MTTHPFMVPSAPDFSETTNTPPEIQFEASTPPPTETEITKTEAISTTIAKDSDTAMEDVATQDSIREVSTVVITTTSSPITTMAPPPPPPPSQVFAPKPIRAVLYRPMPQRIHRPVLVHLEDSPMARSPSPVARNASPGAAAVSGYIQHRRSSSAASTTIATEVPGGWSMMNVRTGSGLVTSEIAGEAEEGATAEGSNVLQLYSPSKDVLDELYKIMRNNKAYPFSNFRELSASSTSPSFRTRTPTKTPSSPSHARSRLLSDASPVPEGMRSPEREWGKIVFPSSPISRTSCVRNPMIFNSQFGPAAE